MAKQYSIVFNNPDYDLIVSEVVGDKTITETETFATQILAETALTAIKTRLTNRATNLNSRVTSLNAEIAAINVTLGL